MRCRLSPMRDVVLNHGTVSSPASAKTGEMHLGINDPKPLAEDLRGPEHFHERRIKICELNRSKGDI